MYGLPFEVTLIEAHGLKNVNLMSTMDVYAVVSLTSESLSQKFKSIVDRDCGSHPKWNQTFKFTVDENAAKQGRLFLTITLKSDKSFAVDTVIGEIHIPIKELFDGYDGTGNELKFVSYGVRVPSGKVKGSLEMNYKFGENLTGDTQKEMKEPAMAYPSQGAYPPAVAHPAPSGYPQPAGNGYPQSAPNAYPDPTGKGHPPQANAYPPPGGYGYPAPSPNGYPVSGGYPAPQNGYPSAQGYPSPFGYPAPAPAPAPGYGCPQAEYGYQQHEKPKKVKKNKKGKKKGGLGKALEMGAGFLGGLILGEAMDSLGDAVEDAAEESVLDMFDS